MERQKSNKRFRYIIPGRSRASYRRLFTVLVLLALGVAYVGYVKNHKFVADMEKDLGAVEQSKAQENVSAPKYRKKGKIERNSKDVNSLKGLRNAIRSEQAQVKALTLEIKEKREDVREAQEHKKRAEESLERKAVKTNHVGNKFVADKFMVMNKGMIDSLQNNVKEKSAELEATRKRLAKENAKLSSYQNKRESLVKGLRTADKEWTKQQESTPLSTLIAEEEGGAHRNEGDSQINRKLLVSTQVPWG